MILFCMGYLLGKSGNLAIDENGDRVTSYQLEIAKKGVLDTFAIFHGPTKSYQFVNSTTVVWPGGGTTAPLGRPPCGFDNEFCPPKPVGTCERFLHFQQNSLQRNFKIYFNQEHILYIFIK